MSRIPLTALTAAFGLGTAAYAEVPRVVADIAPVHSLVARVMEGVAAPELILPPGSSPHEHTLRPSEAKALQDAELIFWIGEDLTPWFGETIATLADGATEVPLSEVEGSLILPFREGVLFDSQDAHDHDDDHGEDENDPHSWLSPDNAALWLDAIAGALSDADPDHAEVYAINAKAGREELSATRDDIANVLAPLKERRFVVFHDAYQYFESTFDLQAFGAISLADASDPSPARIAEIRDRIAEDGIDCVLAEPQFNAGLVDTVLDGTTARTAVLDPLGASLEPGPQFYTQLLRNLANALSDCLS
ncbi:zinc transporter [Silicimonas algicola]|uniref:High-affinity zinc uptake system protein ZnuA n=1 Tax=Silicimonas algicola TaxID=1826607 RepID=A0A316GEJ4_9RHOB|nr:zinc ABC transporter substrate-binding protein [Silicimonas algicola]AZQ66067.1 zinc transporter [Silicimonas algicola]PWK58366.1 zinc transport system substrate-binding protein [Silicimonas algicola]